MHVLTQIIKLSKMIAEGGKVIVYFQEHVTEFL
jgi:hypothetical protein